MTRKLTPWMWKSCGRKPVTCQISVLPAMATTLTTVHVHLLAVDGVGLGRARRCGCARPCAVSAAGMRGQLAGSAGEGRSVAAALICSRSKLWPPPLRLPSAAAPPPPEPPPPRLRCPGSRPAAPPPKPAVAGVAEVEVGREAVQHDRLAGAEGGDDHGALGRGQLDALQQHRVLDQPLVGGDEVEGAPVGEADVVDARVGGVQQPEADALVTDGRGADCRCR